MEQERERREECKMVAVALWGAHANEQVVAEEKVKPVSVVRVSRTPCCVDRCVDAMHALSLPLSLRCSLSSTPLFHPTPPGLPSPVQNAFIPLCSLLFLDSGDAAKIVCLGGKSRFWSPVSFVLRPYKSENNVPKCT